MQVHSTASIEINTMNRKTNRKTINMRYKDGTYTSSDMLLFVNPGLMYRDQYIRLGGLPSSVGRVQYTPCKKEVVFLAVCPFALRAHNPRSWWEDVRRTNAPLACAFQAVFTRNNVQTCEEACELILRGQKSGNYHPAVKVLTLSELSAEELPERINAHLFDFSKLINKLEDFERQALNLGMLVSHPDSSWRVRRQIANRLREDAESSVYHMEITRKYTYEQLKAVCAKSHSQQIP